MYFTIFLNFKLNIFNIFFKLNIVILRIEIKYIISFLS